jgi:ribonuclease BN (tRNA processing enzyme)
MGDARNSGNKPLKRHDNKSNNNALKIIPLGGLDGIGKNMTCFEYQNEMILVDAGLMFPDDDHPGVDLILPDYTYVLENANKLKGIFITHGHEDHTGALPYLIKDLGEQVPKSDESSLVEESTQTNDSSESEEMSARAPTDVREMITKLKRDVAEANMHAMAARRDYRKKVAEHEHTKTLLDLANARGGLAEELQEREQELEKREQELEEREQALACSGTAPPAPSDLIDKLKEEISSLKEQLEEKSMEESAAADPTTAPWSSDTYRSAEAEAMVLRSQLDHMKTRLDKAKARLDKAKARSKEEREEAKVKRP